MKRFTAILSAVLLVWALFASAPAAVTAACQKSCGMPGNGSCHMACCGTNAPTPPQPSTPPPASAQNEISLLAPATIAWVQPSLATSFAFAANSSPLPTAGVSLYARNCVFLI